MRAVERKHSRILRQERGIHPHPATHAFIKKYGIDRSAIRLQSLTGCNGVIAAFAHRIRTNLQDDGDITVLAKLLELIRIRPDHIELDRPKTRSAVDLH